MELPSFQLEMLAKSRREEALKAALERRLLKALRTKSRTPIGGKRSSQAVSFPVKARAHRGIT